YDRLRHHADHRDRLGQRRPRQAARRQRVPDRHGHGHREAVDGRHRPGHRLRAGLGLWPGHHHGHLHFRPVSRAPRRAASDKQRNAGTQGRAGNAHIVPAVFGWPVRTHHKETPVQYEDRQEALVRTFGVVDAYHDDDGIFVVSPDRMGFGVMAKPIAGFDQQMGEALNALLNVPFPAGTILQFCLYASPDIEDVLLRFEMMRQYETDPTLCEMTRQRISFLRDLTQRPIGQVAGARLRQMRLVICASMKEGSSDPTFEEMTRIRELQQNFEAALKTIGFRFERLSAGSYVRFMESILNHGPDAIWRRSAQSDHEAGELLCNQLLDPDTAIEVDSDEIRLGSHCHVRIQHPKRYPDYLYPGLAQYYMGDIMKGMRAMRDPVLYTVNILYPDHEAKRSALLRDFQWATRNAEG